MLKKLLSSQFTEQRINTGLLIFRLTVALLMLGHGIGKLSDFIGGETEFPDPLGIGGRASLAMATLSEFGCSILLVFGLFTRVALIPLIITMLVAVFIFHAGDPLDGRELALLYLFPYIALFITGPGKYSLDHYFFNREH